ncbi:MAG: N-acetylornithine carbamoyltransferase [Phycisphaerae bacterium]|nr:MAG: N-acetylornithine carbamoyltransferase [Planctomycetota bacterium]KAB2945969.1 MAG: N-acetylornithine carbamoyltransferase [Phycisphaerae bacterium]MBE7458163.1 N-acetylornithine carbamoyltransferase [Planctomycetia bacterium]MCL4718077.1 N-acetylornithine carbamoyltransferase [Phycisphaerae bacterium]MCQ3920211.1 N-acetylornithine carbamoyltransferase [Planctomycetota bacterium]
MHGFVHWTADSLESLRRMLAAAKTLKSRRDRLPAEVLRGRVMGMVFFNPSLRTRTSFEALMARLGGHAICLNVGGDTWALEHRDGVVMDGAAAEHIREAAPVLSRYCDVLGVRTFAGLKDAAEDAKDAVIRSFARYATVPVINMESAMEHPCQGLADRMTIEEKLGDARGKRFVLTWAPHIKALPMAVPHSAVLAAASAGMHVTVAHPPGYELNADVVAAARRWCTEAGASFEITSEQRSACRAADVVYVKSWGSAVLYGKTDEQAASFRAHRDWTVGVRHFGKSEAILMHCLPVRRNVVITDEALDSAHRVVVDQAENRMWAQMAVVMRMMDCA